MAEADPGRPMLDGVGAIFRAVSCGGVCTVLMRPGTGAENCLNTRNILAGVAGSAQLGRHRPLLTQRVPQSLRTGPGVCVTEWGYFGSGSRRHELPRVALAGSSSSKSIESACGGDGSRG